jgi:hypothetical protein
MTVFWDLTPSKKLKLSPALHGGTWGGGGDIAPTHFRTQHYMGWVVSVTPRLRFTPGERTPCTHCTGGWVGRRAGLDTEARGKILSPLPRIEPRSSGRPACTQTLYLLSYPAHFGAFYSVKNLPTFRRCLMPPSSGRFPWLWMQKEHLKLQSTFTRLHDATSQKTAVFINTGGPDSLKISLPWNDFNTIRARSLTY